MAEQKTLRQMVELKTHEGLTKSTAFKIDPREIRIESGFNARAIDENHVESIKASIKENMRIPPIIVKAVGNAIYVRDGHHRVEAYCQLIREGEKIDKIDAIEFKGTCVDEIFLLLTSAQGKPLAPVEQGCQFKKLTKKGLSHAQIAKKIGKTVQHVGQMLKLIELPEDVLVMVKSGDVSARVAMAAVKKNDAAAKSVLQAGIYKAHAAGRAKAVKRDLNDDQISLEKAIRLEIRSNGLWRAEKFCEKHADLIAYLRGSK
jgi:ParB/RepB/Spo0J family partition protein